MCLRLQHAAVDILREHVRIEELNEEQTQTTVPLPISKTTTMSPSYSEYGQPEPFRLDYAATHSYAVLLFCAMDL